MFAKTEAHPESRPTTTIGIAFVFDPTLLSKERLGELRALTMDLIQSENPESGVPVDKVRHLYTEAVSPDGRRLPVEAHAVSFAQPVRAESLRRMADECKWPPVVKWLDRVGVVNFLANLVITVQDILTRVRDGKPVVRLRRAG